MELKGQRRLAAKVMKCGESRVWMDPARLGDISQAITAQDIRRLVADGVIRESLKKAGINRSHRSWLISQKKKGRRRGKGSRKGGTASRFDRKSAWIARVRVQRKLLKELLVAGKVDKMTYKFLYARSKGGFFRSRSHVMGFVEELPKQKSRA
jgi:large subunit ribosomal protein L19e